MDWGSSQKGNKGEKKVLEKMKEKNPAVCE